MKIDGTVKKETYFVALCTFGLSCLMQAVFLLLDKWSLAVLWGNLFSAALAVLNFLLLGITVQKALNDDPENAQKRMKASQSYRMLALTALLAGAAFLGAEYGTFNIVALIVPQFFVRVALIVRGVMIAKNAQSETYDPLPDDEDEEGDEL